MKKIRVYLENNVTPDLIEEAVPLIRDLHQEVVGTPLQALNVEFLRAAVSANIIRVVLAREEGKLVGFILMYMFTSILGQSEATINHVYVAKTHRGTELGVADQLLSVAVAMADAAGARCSAVAEREHAINLFLRNGFEAKGVSLERGNGK